MPYALMFPITCSYLVVKYLSFRESRGDPQYRAAWTENQDADTSVSRNSSHFVGSCVSEEVQGWLLLNAWGRAMLTILLLFHPAAHDAVEHSIPVQVHGGWLSSARGFARYCLYPGSTYKGRASKQALCRFSAQVQFTPPACLQTPATGDLADTNYQLLFGMASLGWFVFGSGFAVLNVCLYWSYHWQAGTKTRNLAARSGVFAWQPQFRFCEWRQATASQSTSLLSR